ncbi:FUSC family membrane protein [Pedobacter jamesrossensis]|uniref:FUSC family membrane protein n=1 Tax=Pedobacter jamesrossensis TaxID=1908238 RepID=UPI00360D098D
MALGLAVVILTFIFSMFAIFGFRMVLIGLTSTVLAIFILGLRPTNPIAFSINILIGGLWYYLISLLQVWIWPYRSIHHAIYECLTGTASLLALRAKAYDESLKPDDFDNQNILLHLKLNSKQELMRDLLIGDKRTMSKGNQKGNRLLAIGQDVIDLYEQVTAIHQDYELLQGELKKIEALKLVQSLIKMLSIALYKCSSRFLGKNLPKNQILGDKFEQDLKQLFKLADISTLPLPEKVAVNIQSIANLIKNIDSDIEIKYTNDIKKVEYLDFLSKQQPLNIKDIKSQFSIHAPVFRFALRLSILSLIAMCINYWIPEQHYTYWFLLTIMIVNRPSFGLTRKRNSERLKGTIIGLVVSFILLQLSLSIWLQLILSILSLLGFFAFNRIKYLFSVFCITVMVILCLNIYHGSPLLLIGDRLIFTLMGCGLSYVAAYIFPIWEAPRIKMLISETISANRDYLFRVLSFKNGDANLHQIRLARKVSYLKFASFTEALESLKKEPQSSSLDMNGLLRIQALCYQINGHIAGISSSNDSAINDGYLKSGVLEDLDYCKLKSRNLNITSINKSFNADDESVPLLSKLVNKLKQNFT